MQAREQLCHLGQRRHGPAAQDDHGDQRPHRHAALTDEQHAEHNERNGGDLLHGDGEVEAQERQRAGAHARACRRGHRFLPLAAHAAFGADALDGLEAADGLDQHAVLGAGVAETAAHGGTQRDLDDQAGDQHQRHGDRQDHGQRAGDEPDHEDEKQHEGQVDDGNQGGRGEEVPQRLEFAHGVGEIAGRS